MAAGLATLGMLTAICTLLQDGDAGERPALTCKRHDVPFTAGHAGSIMGLLLSSGPVRVRSEAKQSGRHGALQTVFHAARRREDCRWRRRPSKPRSCQPLMAPPKSTPLDRLDRASHGVATGATSRYGTAATRGDPSPSVRWERSLMAAFCRGLCARPDR
jgi:hypothetical protein